MALATYARHFARGSMTISSTAIAITNAGFGFSAAQLAAADVAYIFTATNSLRLLSTGDAPTATQGVPVETTGGVIVEGNTNVQNIQLIRQSADGVATIILGQY